jgi:hypothetical protein
MESTAIPAAPAATNTVFLLAFADALGEAVIKSRQMGVKGAVAGLVGIESGVVSGLANPNDSALERRVETTPWKALPRSLRCRI